MKKNIVLFIMFFISIFSTAYAATIQNPVDMLENSMVSTQDEMVKNTDMYQKDPYALLELINKNIIPIVDEKVIAQLVVSPDKWNKATPEEQKEFIKDATEMLVFLYAKNVAYAGKYKIALFPFTDDSWKNKSIVVVNGKVINNTNNQSSDFSVKLFKKKDGSGWSVYDFNVAGISVVETYKQQFAGYDTVPEMTQAIIKTTDKMKQKSYPELLTEEQKNANDSDSE